MYEFVDRHPNTLDSCGRFLLWATRGWAQAASRKACPPHSLYRGFTKVGAVSALAHFHVVMALLHRDSLEPLTVAEMACCRIREDEALLLSLWQHVGRDRGAVLAATLEHMVKPESVMPIARALTSCRTQLLLAGFEPSIAGTAKIED